MDRDEIPVFQGQAYRLGGGEDGTLQPTIAPATQTCSLSIDLTAGIVQPTIEVIADTEAEECDTAHQTHLLTGMSLVCATWPSIIPASRHTDSILMDVEKLQLMLAELHSLAENGTSVDTDPAYKLFSDLEQFVENIRAPTKKLKRHASGPSEPEASPLPETLHEPEADPELPDTQADPP